MDGWCPNGCPAGNANLLVQTELISFPPNDRCWGSANGPSSGPTSSQLSGPSSPSFFTYVTCIHFSVVKALIMSLRGQFKILLTGPRWNTSSPRSELFCSPLDPPPSHRKPFMSKGLYLSSTFTLLKNSSLKQRSNHVKSPKTYSVGHQLTPVFKFLHVVE